MLSCLAASPFHPQENLQPENLSVLDSRESFCPRIFVEEMFVCREPLRVISKTGLVFDSLDSCLRAIFGAIYTDQKFSVFANLSLLLEPA
jgi:hypothetical protein